jgi:hypothetical protein
LDYLAQCWASGWRRPFRGEIWEYAGKLSLGQGYAVQGRIDIETLGYLVEPLEAIRDPRVRVVSILGAVQTCKSLIVDMCVPYWIENDPGDTLWLLEDDKKAKEYGERALSLIESVPEIAGMLEDVDRHDKTKMSLRFRHMKLVLAGLNPGNVQSLSWKNVIVDEAWLHPFDGLIRQAMDRTRQYPDTRKIILLGQGGVEGDDHDREHKGTDRRELHWRCPGCGRYQKWELNGEVRPSETGGAAISRGKAGLVWEVSERTRPGGRWNAEAVASSAVLICRWCGEVVRDTAQGRRQLMSGYRYWPALWPEAQKSITGNGDSAKGPEEPVTALPRGEGRIPFPRAVGFWWPAPASPRISFGEVAARYVRALAAAEEEGYKLPLKEFYQKDWGLPWSEDLEGDYREMVREEYDPKGEWKEEGWRVLIGDCQRDLAKFFATVFGISAGGEVRELARKTVGSFQEIADLQGEWRVRDQHVFLDCGYEMTKVLRECVKHGHVGQVQIAGKLRKVWLCWTGMKGSGQELFRWQTGQGSPPDWKLYGPVKYYDTNIGLAGGAKRAPRSPWFEWSNLHCKDLLRARRDGESGLPKWLTLPDELPGSDRMSYFAQMRSEKRVESYFGGRKRAIWLPVSEGRPNHWWDISAMCIGVMARLGVIGSPGEVEAEASPHGAGPGG